MSREGANDEDFLQCPKASLGVVMKCSRKEAKLDMKRPAVVAAKALWCLQRWPQKDMLVASIT